MKDTVVACSHFSINETKSQDTRYGEELLDRSSSGRVRPWKELKMKNTYISFMYESIDERKSDRMKECASLLVFNKANSGLKLKAANFCRVRLCPLCQWRRSLKLGGQLRKVIDELQPKKYRYLFLTLTVKNCSGEQLSEQLDKLTAAFTRLTKRKAITSAWQGYFRALEVTHNKRTGEHHPHFHVLVAVERKYFSGRNYLSHADYVSLWRKALKVDYDPMVNVQAVKKDSESGIVAEVAKYAVKPDDVIYYDDWDLGVEVLRVLDKALDNRRFVGFGGALKEAHKKLQFEDADEGDLVHTDEDKPSEEKEEELVFAWLSGYGQYRKVM